MTWIIDLKSKIIYIYICLHIDWNLIFRSCCLTSKLRSVNQQFFCTYDMYLKKKKKNYHYRCVISILETFVLDAPMDRIRYSTSRWAFDKRDMDSGDVFHRPSRS